MDWGDGQRHGPHDLGTSCSTPTRPAGWSTFSGRCGSSSARCSGWSSTSWLEPSIIPITLPPLIDQGIDPTKAAEVGIDTKQFYFVASLAFIAGFSERFAQDALSVSGDRVLPGADRERLATAAMSRTTSAGDPPTRDRVGVRLRISASSAQSCWKTASCRFLFHGFVATGWPAIGLGPVTGTPATAAT